MTTTNVSDDPTGRPTATGSVASPVDTTPSAPGGLEPEGVTRGRLVLRRFLRNRLALFGLAVLVLLYAVSSLSPLFAPWRYDEFDYTAFLSPPSGSHWFGTT